MRTMLLLAMFALAAPAFTAEPTWVPTVGQTPGWFTQEVRSATDMASEQGLAYSASASQAVPLPLDGIRPGILMLRPQPCTMGFVFGDPGSYQISTAGHCVKSGQAVTVQAHTDDGSLISARIGHVSALQDEGPGRDWALVDIDPRFQDSVSPSTAFLGGPSGTYHAAPSNLIARSPVPIKHLHHCLGLCPGVPVAGISHDAGTSNRFTFYGVQIEGDSGGPVLTAGDADDPFGLAVGIATHRAAFGQFKGLGYGTSVARIPTQLATQSSFSEP